jgi:hypothetical protein
MIDRTRIYQYEQSTVSRDRARRRAERLLRFIVRAFFVLLIAAGLFAFASSFIHAENCPGVPNAPAKCSILAPYIEYPARAYFSIVSR